MNIKSMNDTQYTMSFQIVYLALVPATPAILPGARSAIACRIAAPSFNIVPSSRIKQGTFPLGFIL